MLGTKSQKGTLKKQSNRTLSASEARSTRLLIGSLFPRQKEKEKGSVERKRIQSK